MSAPLIDVSGSDLNPAVSPNEREALASLGWQLPRRRSYDPTLPQWGAVARLLAPLDTTRGALHRPDTALHRRSALDAAGLVLARCAEEGAAYWGWPEEAWVRLIGQDRHAFARPWPDWVDQAVRSYVAAYGYLLCGFDALHRLGSFNRLALAWRVFGRDAMDDAQERFTAKLEGWGYRSARTDLFIRTFLAQLLLINRSARLEDLTSEVFRRLRDDPRLGYRRWPFHAVHRAIAGMGFASSPAAPTRGRQMPVQGAPAEWIACVDRWFATSALTPEVRREYRSILVMAGQWLAVAQPAISSPSDWTRETCAAWVAQVTRTCIGDFAQRRVGLVGRIGRRLAPTSMASYTTVTRTFFRDCQEWAGACGASIPKPRSPPRAACAPCLVLSRASPPTTPGPRYCGPD